VRPHVHAALEADRIVWHALVDGLGGVGGADRGQWPRGQRVGETARRSAKQRDCGDVIGRLRCGRGGQIHDGSTLGVATKNHSGAGATRRHRPQVGARVRGAGGRALGEVLAGRIVDRVHPDGSPIELRTKRVDEHLPDAADARRFGGAAREDDLDVGTGARGGKRRTRQRREHAGHHDGDTKCPRRRASAHFRHNPLSHPGHRM